MQLGPCQSMELKTQEMKVNPSFDANRFELPDEIKLLKSSRTRRVVPVRGCDCRDR